MTQKKTKKKTLETQTIPVTRILKVKPKFDLTKLNPFTWRDLAFMLLGVVLGILI
jgi:hypothetical protein